MARFEFSEVKEPALNPPIPDLDQNWLPTEDAKKVLIEALGSGYRLATTWKSTKPVRQLRPVRQQLARQLSGKTEKPARQGQRIRFRQQTTTALGSSENKGNTHSPPEQEADPIK